MVNFTSTIFAEGELIYTDGGLLAKYAWLLVLLPFVAALIITFMGKYLPLKGAEVALATIGLIFLYKVSRNVFFFSNKKPVIFIIFLMRVVYF